MKNENSLDRFDTSFSIKVKPLDFITVKVTRSNKDSTNDRF